VQNDGANSLPIGATLGSVNKNGVVRARSVIDVNKVNALAAQQVVNGKTAVNNYQSVGWLYLDDQGGVWFQFDPLTPYSISVTWNVHRYFGLPLNIPNHPRYPVYVATPPKVAAANNHLQTVTCWGKGRTLVPGTVSAASVSTNG
jgi:hypothetical protein